MSRRYVIGVAVAVAAAVLAAACDSGTTGSPPTSPAPTTTALPETTALPATSGPATSSTEAVTTAAPPPSTTAGPLPRSWPASTGEPCEKIITEDCVDPQLTTPFIDVDEQRTTTDARRGVTVSYRYVHGGFTDNPKVTFAFYFPDAAKYQGRFFESTYPTVPVEDASADAIVLGIANGAYVVSSNNGGGVAANPAIGGLRANAAAAKFSKVVARSIYGASAPTRGYLYGASGGAYQTLGGAEYSDGVWAGTVPMVPGVPNAIPSFQSMQVLGLRTLGPKLAAVADAVDAGGTGDPYATLTDQEKATLAEITKMGFPLRGWWQWETLTGGSFGIVVQAVLGVDRSYPEEFWTKPGYEGHDDPTVQAARVRFDTTVTAVDGDTVTLSRAPKGFVQFSDLVITSGAAAGKTISTVRVDGATVAPAADAAPGVFSVLARGDHVRVDNSLYLALQYFPRHNLPAATQYGWNQYRDAGGAPRFPQRSVLVGQVIASVFGGVATGHLHGKMIMLASTMDVQAYPWSADWYQGQAEAALGDQFGDRFRLWYMDHADHQPPSTQEGYAHIVLYSPELEQALLDLDAWVRDDTPPPASSGYQMTDDNAVELAPAAAARRGVQPVVTLNVAAGKECDTASTAAKVDVAAGAPVAMSARAGVPPGAGKIVKIEWDFESTGTFPDSAALGSPGSQLNVCGTHVYDTAGTHFATVRVTAQRDGDPAAAFGLIQNLARVRVVVG